MAVAYSEFRNLIGRIDNDNRPGFFAVKSSLPSATAENPDRHARARVRQSRDPSGARDRHAVGVFRSIASGPASPPDLLADLPPLPGMAARRVRRLRARGDAVPASGLGLTGAGAWNMGGDLASFTSLIRDQDEAALRSYGYRCDRHPLRQLPRPRPADHDRGPDPGRRDRRRLRGDADQRRRHRRADGQVRAARDPVQPVPRHGRAQLPEAPGRRAAWRAR